MAERKQLTDVVSSAISTALTSLAQNPIAVITAVGEKTISCKPVINRVVNGEEIEMPEFIEVPPVFLYGAQSYEAYPLAVGDYCLLMISERCFDLWYEGQDFRPPAEFRVHDYSDAFALIGIRNKAGAFAIPDDGRIWQIGDKYKEGDHEHVGNLVHTGSTTQEGDYTQTGDYNQTGNQGVTGNVTATGTVQGATVAATSGFSIGGTAGVDATFTTSDGKTVTVTKGLITQVI